MSKGRTDDAQDVLNQLGEHRDVSEFEDEIQEKTRWATLFDKEYIARC